MSDLPPLAAIRVFEAAARHGNFSRAADELSMSQAAVSYQIKSLEERLGVRLFMRRGRGIALTDVGRRIAPQVAGSFTALRETFGTIRAENEAILSITAPRTFATNWLAGRLGDFHRARPDLNVRLDVSDQLVDLASSEFDAAVRGVPSPTPGLVSHHLMGMPLTPLASPSFLAAYKLEEPEDLFLVPRLSPGDEWWRFWFTSVPGLKVNQDTGPAIRFDSQVLDGHAAIAGHGVAILSPPMFKDALQAGLLVQPFHHCPMYRSSFWLVYPEHKRNVSKIRSFRDWLSAEITKA